MSPAASAAGAAENANPQAQRPPSPWPPPPLPAAGLGAPAPLCEEGAPSRRAPLRRGPVRWHLGLLRTGLLPAWVAMLCVYTCVPLRAVRVQSPGPQPFRRCKAFHKFKSIRNNEPSFPQLTSPHLPWKLMENQSFEINHKIESFSSRHPCWLVVNTFLKEFFGKSPLGNSFKVQKENK